MADDSFTDQKKRDPGWGLSSSWWEIVLAVTISFLVGIMLGRSTYTVRVWAPCSTNEFQKEYRAAASFAEGRGLDVKSPGMGFMMHLRDMYIGGHQIAIAVPSNHTHARAWNSHVEIIDTGKFSKLETNQAVEVLSRFCKSGGPRLFVDIGANIGYFSILAAAMGCKAYAFDGNLEAQAYTRLSIALNGFNESQIRVISKLVSNVSVIKFDGWTSVGGLTNKPTPSYATNQAVPLDDVVTEPVLWLKVDAEGGEPFVFASAHQTFAKYTPWYVHHEVTLWLNGEGFQYGYLEIFQLLRLHRYTCGCERIKGLIVPPATRAEYDELLMKYDAICDKSKPFCQDNFLCVSADALYNPWVAA